MSDRASIKAAMLARFESHHTNGGGLHAEGD